MEEKGWGVEDGTVTLWERTRRLLLCGGDGVKGRPKTEETPGTRVTATPTPTTVYKEGIVYRMGLLSLVERQSRGLCVIHKSSVRKSSTSSSVTR